MGSDPASRSGRRFGTAGYGFETGTFGPSVNRSPRRAWRLRLRFGRPWRVDKQGDRARRHTDIVAAHAAGAIAVGVASGHLSKEELRSAGADYVLGSLLEELPGVAVPVS